MTALASGPYVMPELSFRLLKQGARVPDKVTCPVIPCDQEPVFPLTYGVSVLVDPVFVQVRRTVFLDLRAGLWATSNRGNEPGRFFAPMDQRFPFVGLRYVHHTGDGELLLDGYAMQFGVLSHYTSDFLPDHVGGYVEFTYLHYVWAAWSRRSSRHCGGFVLRMGANFEPIAAGVNITVDPGFGFSAMFEITARGGVSLGPS